MKNVDPKGLLLAIEKMPLGGYFESGVLFPGLSKEPMVWMLSNKNDRGVYTFDVSYHGVYMQTAVCKIADGKMTWRFGNGAAS